MIKLIELEIGKKAKIEFRPLQDGDMISTFANINHTIEKISYAGNSFTFYIRNNGITTFLSNGS